MADGTIRINTKIDESGLDKSLNKMSGSLSSFAKLAAGIFAGIALVDFGKSALKSQADLELAVAKMTTLLGSAQDAQMMMKDIVKMADVTPYNSNDLIQAATTLKTFGVSARDILPTLTALGNAAGGSAENLAGVARALGQTKAQGKMMTQDLYQFVNAGVPLLELLSETLGKNTADIKKMIEAGKIGFPQVQDALQKFYTGTGKYANLMERAAKTLPGMYSTMQDALMSFGRAIVTGLEPQIKSFLSTVTKLFSSLAKFIEDLSPGTKDAIVNFIEIGAAIAAIIVAFNYAVTAVGLFKIALIAVSAHPLLAIVVAVALITSALAEAIAKLTIFSKEFEDLERAQKENAEATRKAAQHILDRWAGKLQDRINKEKMSDKQIQKMLASYEKFNKKLLASSAITEQQRKRLKAMGLEIEGLQKKYGTGEPPPPTGADDEWKKRVEEQRALYADTWQWLLTHNMESIEAELTQLAYEHQKKIEMANENAATLLMIQAQYEQQRKDIIAKGKQEDLHGGAAGNALQYFFGIDIKALEQSFAFFKKGMIAQGLGWTLKDLGADKAGELVLSFAKGIDAGLYVVTSVVKGLAAMCWAAFSTVWGILSKGFDILSWMSDFSPSDIFNSFKSFMTGLTDFFTKDIGSLPIFFDMGVKVFEDFINGMIENLPAIVETIGNVIDHIVTYIIDNAPALIDKILNILMALFDKLVEKLPQIIDAIMTIVSAITEKLPEIVGKILNALVVALRALGDNAEEFAGTIVDAIAGILDAISKNISPLLTAVIQIILNLIKGIIEKLPVLIPAILELVKAIILAIVDAIPVIIEMLPALITALIEAIIQMLDEHEIEKIVFALAKGILQAIPQIIKAIVLAVWDIFTESIPALFKGLYDVGKNIVLGIKKGFTDYAPRIWDAIKGFFTGLIDKIKRLFGIHSPSTVFASIGKDCILGFIEGVKSLANALKNVFASVFSGVFSFLSGLVSKFTSLGSSFASALVDGFKNMAGNLGSTLTDAFEKIFAPIGDIFSKLAAPLEKVYSLLENLRAMDLSPIRVLGDVFDKIKDAVGGLVDKLQSAIDKLKELASAAGSGVAGGLGGLGDTITGGLGGLGDAITGGLGGIGHKFGFASGTNYAPGGLALVGEEGAELVNLPRGSQVFPYAETKAFLSGKGFQSLVNGLSTGVSMTPALATGSAGAGGMTIKNIMTGTLTVDGKTLARIVYQNLDKVHKAAYGN